MQPPSPWSRAGCGSPRANRCPGAGAAVRSGRSARRATVAATTDRSGQFTLPLATLAGALPERFELGANYPNPFNPSTMIPYQLATAMYVRLEVFNILGQRVATLVDGEQSAGFHTASWDATDAAGEGGGAGVYLYRLSGDGVQATRSMLLIDGQAGIASGRGGPSGWEGEAGAGEDGERASVFGLTVSGPGLVPYVDPAFRIEGAMGPLDLVVGAPGRLPPAKVVSSGGILGDVDNTGGVDFFDALLVALYSLDSLCCHAQQRRYLPWRRQRRRRGRSGRRLAHRRLAERSLRSVAAGRHRRARGSGRFAVSRPFDGDLRRRRGLAPVHGGGRRAGHSGGQPRDHPAAGDHHPQQWEQLLPGRSRRRRLAPGRPSRLPGRLRHRHGHGGTAAAIGWHGPEQLYLRGDRKPGGPGSAVGFCQRQHPDARAILHAQSHGAQSGHGSVGGDDPALLPLVEPDDFDAGYPGRQRCGGRPWPFTCQRRVDPPDGPVERRHVLLRGLCSQPGGRKCREQLLGGSPRHGGDRHPGSDRGVPFGQRQQSDARAILHPEGYGAQPGRGSVGGDHPALLPLDQRDDFYPGYASRHRPGGRSCRFSYQCRVDPSDRPVERGHLVLRRLCGRRQQRERHPQQLLQFRESNRHSCPGFASVEAVLDGFGHG